MTLKEYTDKVLKELEDKFYVVCGSEVKAWSFEEDAVKDFIQSAVEGAWKEMGEEIINQYNRYYQSECLRNKYTRKTPNTIFHKIISSLTSESVGEKGESSS